MRSHFQPVRLHASVHDDEPCQCAGCVALRGRLQAMVLTAPGREDPVRPATDER